MWKFRYLTLLLLLRSQNRFSLVLKSAIKEDWLLLLKWVITVEDYGLEDGFHVQGSHFYMGFCRIAAVLVRYSCVL